MQNASTPIPAGYGTVSRPAALGLDFGTQAFLMMATLNTGFAAGSDVAQLQSTNGPVRGSLLSLRIRVTVSVTYTASVPAGRRRRRQASDEASPSNTASVELEPVAVASNGEAARHKAVPNANKANTGAHNMEAHSAAAPVAGNQGSAFFYGLVAMAAVLLSSWLL